MTWNYYTIVWYLQYIQQIFQQLAPQSDKVKVWHESHDCCFHKRQEVPAEWEGTHPHLFLVELFLQTKNETDYRTLLFHTLARWLFHRWTGWSLQTATLLQFQSRGTWKCILQNKHSTQSPQMLSSGRLPVGAGHILYKANSSGVFPPSNISPIWPSVGVKWSNEEYHFWLSPLWNWIAGWVLHHVYSALLEMDTIVRIPNTHRSYFLYVYSHEYLHSRVPRSRW